MFQSAVHIVLAGLAALFPIALWGYAFSYLDADRFNARRFGLGILAWAAAVFPIAFMPELSAMAPSFWNVFQAIAERVPTASATIEYSVFLLAVSFVVLVAAFVLRSSPIFHDAKPLGRSLVAVGISIPVFALAFWLLSGVSESSSPEVRIAGATLSGFASIALAYLVVAAVEEGGKHLWLYGTGSFVEIAERGVLYAAFVALGFAFAENVLYLSSLLRSDAPFSSFFSTWISRSVFSVGVHTLCSIAAAVPFVRAIRRSENPSKTLALATKGILFAVALHAIFDVTVSYGKTGIVFLYAIVAYVFMTRAFHKPETGTP